MFEDTTDRDKDQLREMRMLDRQRENRRGGPTMTPDVHAAHELIERELEHMVDTIHAGDTARALALLPLYTILTLALDLLDKAIAFDDSDTPTSRERRGV